MAEKVKVWFDSEADYLEVQFREALGFMRATAHDAGGAGHNLPRLVDSRSPPTLMWLGDPQLNCAHRASTFL